MATKFADPWVEDDVAEICPGALVTGFIDDDCPCCRLVVYPDDATPAQLEALREHCRGSGGWGLEPRSKFEAFQKEAE